MVCSGEPLKPPDRRLVLGVCVRIGQARRLRGRKGKHVGAQRRGGDRGLMVLSATLKLEQVAPKLSGSGAACVV